MTSQWTVDIYLSLPSFVKPFFTRTLWSNLSQSYVYICSVSQQSNGFIMVSSCMYNILLCYSVPLSWCWGLMLKLIPSHQYIKLKSLGINCLNQACSHLTIQFPAMVTFHFHTFLLRKPHPGLLRCLETLRGAVSAHCHPHTSSILDQFSPEMTAFHSPLCHRK